MSALQLKAGFPSTNWELFALLRHDQQSQRQTALGELVNRYWPAVRYYLLAAKRLSVAEAEEVRSCFTVERLLAERSLFDQADNRRGRFRNLLVRALENFVIDLRRRKEARHEQGSEALENSIAATPTNPLAVFERTWARSILQQVLEETRAHLLQTNQEITWLIFEQRVARPASDGCEPTPYAELVRRFSLRTPVQASNLLSSAKRVFDRRLRHALAAHAETGESFEDQLANLQEILAFAAE